MYITFALICSEAELNVVKIIFRTSISIFNIILKWSGNGIAISNILSGKLRS
jgi:hypothetical protein